MNIQYYVGSFVHGRGWPLVCSIRGVLRWYETEREANEAAFKMTTGMTYAEAVRESCWLASAVASMNRHARFTVAFEGGEA